VAAELPLEPEETMMARVRVPALLVALGLAIALVVAGCGNKGGAASSSNPTGPQQFVAMAQGVSQATPRPNHDDILNIDLQFIYAPWGLEGLKVHKFLVTRPPPPFKVHDGTYTLTATNGDQMVLTTSGFANLPPASPDKFFATAFEDWTVKSGTGRFAGATGSGKVISPAALDVLGKNRNAVVKFFVGQIDLKGE
jgi:hypothetical protein